MTHIKHARIPQGFTLIELMVTVAVFAILLTLGVPSLQGFVNSGRLTNQANDILAALNLARSEAIRQNLRVVFCRSEDGASCDNTAGSWGGWIVFVDNNRNGSRDAGETLLRSNRRIADTLRIEAGPTLAATGNVVSFRPDGFARNGAATMDTTLSVCMVTTAPNENARTVNLRAGSQFDVLRVANNGACPAPMGN